MENKQTAVEWLAQKYNYITWMRDRDEMSPETADKYRKDYLEKAKQMEKEQMENLIKLMYKVYQKDRDVLAILAINLLFGVLIITLITFI